MLVAEFAKIRGFSRSRKTSAHMLLYVIKTNFTVQKKITAIFNFPLQSRYIKRMYLFVQLQQQEKGQHEYETFER